MSINRYKKEEVISKLDILTAKVITLVVRASAESLMERQLTDRQTLLFVNSMRDPVKAIISQTQNDIFDHIADKLSKNTIMSVSYSEPTLADTYLEPKRLSAWMKLELDKWRNS